MRVRAKIAGYRDRGDGHWIEQPIGSVFELKPDEKPSFWMEPLADEPAAHPAELKPSPTGKTPAAPAKPGPKSESVI